MCQSLLIDFELVSQDQLGHGNDLDLQMIADYCSMGHWCLGQSAPILEDPMLVAGLETWACDCKHEFAELDFVLGGGLVSVGNTKTLS